MSVPPWVHRTSTEPGFISILWLGSGAGCWRWLPVSASGYAEAPGGLSTVPLQSSEDIFRDTGKREADITRPPPGTHYLNVALMPSLLQQG